MKRVFDQSMISTRLSAFYSPLIGFLPNLGLAALLFFGGRQAIHGSITVGEFVAFFGYVVMLTGPMRMLGIALGLAQRAVASGTRVFEVLDREPQLTSAPGAPPLPEGNGRVELRDVSFAYDGGRPVLRDLDLTVEAGRTVALVGATGAGKSTLVMLLPRLYDVTEGQLLVDGVDVRSVDVASLRRQVAFVSDDPFLFSASVHENIAYARPDASDDEVRQAASRAGAAEFIDELPRGYDTRIGERGYTLSGGQRQRIAIARALLKDPRILILDDATSSVDATTESRITRALNELTAGRTTFIIAHRLSTIALADEIVVLEDGRIAAHGTPRGAARGVRPLPRDRGEGAARPGVPQPQPRRALGGGRAVRRRLTSLWQLIRRQEDQRARKLRGLLDLLRPYRTRVVLMLVVLVVGTAAGARASLPRRQGDRRRDQDAGHRRDRCDRGPVPGSAVINWLATWSQTYLVEWVGQRVLQDLRLQIFTHLQRLSIGFYSRNKTGVVISRLTNDVEALDQLVTDGVVTLFSAGLTLFGAAAILLILDTHLALITFLIFPLLLIGSLVFRIVSAEAYRLTREKIALVTAYLQETLSGIRVVRAFSQEARHREQFAELNEENRSANMTTVYLNAVYFPSVEFLSAVATAAILLYGGNQVLHGSSDVTIGVLASFVFYLQSFFDPIQQLSQLYTTYQAGMAALDKVFELLDEQPDLIERPDATELPTVRGEIRFEDVSFSYGNGEYALRDIDLTVPPGHTVALVGETGAGKSTFAKLVARFYDPTEGRITIDGHDLRDITERSLRSQLGVVPQEGFLFSGTIRDNIAFGRPDATDEEVRDAARAVGAHEFIEGLSERLRHRGGRARRPPLGRAAAARRVRPRGRGRSAHPDPRRGDLERGRAHRGPDRAGPPPPPGRPHRAS